MKEFIGTKIIKAQEMNLGDYNFYRGWKIPDNEEPSRKGYLVVYEDGYESWSPVEAFEGAYEMVEGKLSFSHALMLLKRGYKIARSGWNGKGMFVVYQKGYPDGIPCNKNTAEAWGMEEGDLFRCEPYLQIKMVNGSHSMWVPSINDVLANDWMVV